LKIIRCTKRCNCFGIYYSHLAARGLRHCEDICQGKISGIQFWRAVFTATIAHNTMCVTLCQSLSDKKQ